MTNYDLVQKVIGPISPAGESHIDSVRYDNLRATTELVELLLIDISHVARHKDRQEASMRKAGIHAQEFMDEMKDVVISS